MEQKIKILRGAQRVRCRPAVIFGDEGIKGVECAWEMLAGLLSPQSGENSSHMVLTLSADGSLILENRSRGIYLGENGQFWQELFCELAAQPREGKTFWDAYTVFDEAEIPPSNAAFDLCAVQYASAHMDVRVVRCGIESILHFEKGENIGGIRQKVCTEPDSTCIRWKPDGEVFRQTQLSAAFLHRKGELMALRAPGMLVTVCTEENCADYCYTKGVAQYLQKRCPGQPYFTSRMMAEGQERYNRPRYTTKLRMGLCFTKSEGNVLCCHNGQELPCGGTHIQGMLEKICQYLEWDFEITVTKKQLCRHLMLVVLTETPEAATCWENGTRKSIANTLIRDMAEDMLDDDFRHYLKENRDHLISCFSEK